MIKGQKMLLCTAETRRCLAFVVSLTAVVWIVAGCSFPQSVNPFYRTEDLVFDATLIGEWQSADPSEKASLVIKARTEDSYTIEATSYDEDREGDVTWTFEGHRFTCGQNSYLDLFPADFDVRGKKESFRTHADGMGFLIPVHSVMRLQHDGQKLSLTWSGEDEPLNWFTKEDETSRTKRLAREKRDHDILTMSTEQLQQEVLGRFGKGENVSEARVDYVRRK